MYRNTYVEVNLKNIKQNVKELIQEYCDYQYYFGVVKADCYGHQGIEVVKTIVEAGCNYLAVATLEEALEIRKELKEIPILCLGIIPAQYIEVCAKNQITVTISNEEYLEAIQENRGNPLKAHIKINTGMNRLGVSTKEECNLVYRKMREKGIVVEGIYTHISSAQENETTLKQYARFEEITSDINLKEIPIVHIGASDATMRYPKRVYANGCRLGIAMYGLADSENKKWLPTFSLYSQVIQINEIDNETVGYSGTYKAKGKERIAVVPVGYADGIIRKNTGRDVYINDKAYPIVGNICMDMLFVKVDNTIKVGDKVAVIKDIEHIRQIAKHLDTITYEVICSIGKRVPRRYVEK